MWFHIVLLDRSGESVEGPHVCRLILSEDEIRDNFGIKKAG